MAGATGARRVSKGRSCGTTNLVHPGLDTMTPMAQELVVGYNPLPAAERVAHYQGLVRSRLIWLGFPAASSCGKPEDFLGKAGFIG